MDCSRTSILYTVIYGDTALSCGHPEKGLCNPEVNLLCKSAQLVILMKTKALYR